MWRPRALDAWRRAGFTVGQTLLDVGSGPGYATFANIVTHQLDLDFDELPDVRADGAWVRWVFAFLGRPRELLARVCAALRPGGILVIHEYFAWETFRFCSDLPSSKTSLVR